MLRRTMNGNLIISCMKGEKYPSYKQQQFHRQLMLLFEASSHSSRFSLDWEEKSRIGGL